MNKFSVKSFLLSFVKRHKILCLLLSIAILLTAFSGLAPSYVLRYLIDSVLTPMIGHREVDTKRIIFVSLLYFGSYLLVTIATFFENYMLDSFGQKLIHELRYAMVEKSHRLTSSYFTHHGTGEMTSRITDDVYSIETLFASGLISLVVNLFKILGILISVFVFSWMLGVILLALIPLIYLLTRLFRKKMLKNQLNNRLLLNQESNHLSESIDNVEMIHNFHAEQHREDSFKNLLTSSYVALNRTAWFDAVYSPIVQFLKAVVIAAVALLVAYGTQSSSDVLKLGISAGTFAASLNLISDVFSPIEQIGQEMESMQEGISGMKRVEDYMNQPERKPADNKLTAQEVLSHPKQDFLVLDHLSFHYPDGDEEIFSDVSLTLKPQEKITIVGRTGAGKTTLFRLLLGLLEPTKGRILFNGYDLSLLGDNEKKKIFGYVEQGFESVSGTIKDQITLGDDSISMEKIKEVMKAVFLDDYVQKEIPSGYDAVFQENLFSRGQLQLLSLARALVHDPLILLLDEISANLDSKTEKELLSALSDASSQRTVISISHRLSGQLGFDKTLKVENGKIQEEK